MNTKPDYNENNNKRTQIIGGALSLTLSTFMVKLLGLLYKIPLSYILSDEGMGYFNSAYTVYTFFYIICTAGVPRAISILTSEKEGELGSCGAWNFCRSALGLFSGFGLIITAAFMLSASYISDAVGSRGALLPMLAIAPSIPFVCASGVIRGYLNGKLKLVPIAVSEVIAGLIKFILGIVFAFTAYKLGQSFEVISAVTILGITLGAVISFLYLLTSVKKANNSIKLEQNFKYSYKNKKVIREILKISVPLTITSAIANFGSIADLGLIMRGLITSGYSEHQAGIVYGNYTTLVLPMLNLTSALLSPICAVLLPIISRKTVKTNTNAIALNTNFALKITLIFALPICTAYFLYSSEILTFLFEDSSALMAAPLLSGISLSVLFLSQHTVLNTVLEGVGKNTVALFSVLISIIVKVILTLILFIGDFGAMSPVFASVISYAVGFIISYFYICIRMKVRIMPIYEAMAPLLFSFVSALISLVPKILLEKGDISVFCPMLFGFSYTALIILFMLKKRLHSLFMSIYTKKA